jgi:hypothetical protein
MNRPLSLLAAFTLTAGSALTLTNPSSAQAMTIAWDCFDRSSNALVARSAIDLTSPAISCLQAAGAGATNIAIDPGADPMGDQDISQEPQPEGPSDDTDSDLTSNPSTGDALGIAIGGHLGKLLGQGIADLFNRR